MGRIDIKLSFPKAVAHTLDDSYEFQQSQATGSHPVNKTGSTTTTIDTNLAEQETFHHAEDPVEAQVSLPNYQVQPRSVPDKNLPEIPSAEVRKCDGKNGAKLCEFGVLNSTCFVD